MHFKWENIPWLYLLGKSEHADCAVLFKHNSPQPQPAPPQKKGAAPPALFTKVANLSRK